MSFESTQVLTYSLIDLFSLLTVVFCLLVISKIYSKKEYTGIKKNFFIIFSILAIGYLFNSLAELTWHFLSLIGHSPELTYPDFFWITGFVFLIAGFFYFSVYMSVKEEVFSKWLMSVIGISLGLSIFLFYIIKNFIVLDAGASGLSIFIAYFYPIAGAFVLILSLSVYRFFSGINSFGKPILFLAIAALFTFVGDMLFTYYSFQDVYGFIGFLSDSFYAISYFCSFFGFFSLYKNFTNKNKKNSVRKVFLGEF